MRLRVAVFILKQKRGKAALICMIMVNYRVSLSVTCHCVSGLSVSQHVNGRKAVITNNSFLLESSFWWISVSRYLLCTHVWMTECKRFMLNVTVLPGFSTTSRLWITRMEKVWLLLPLILFVAKAQQEQTFWGSTFSVPIWCSRFLKLLLVRKPPRLSLQS